MTYSWKPNSQVVEEEIAGKKNLLGKVSSVFDWINRNVEVPFASIVSSPFTPPTQGTENLNWYEREKREYGAWQAPTIRTGVDLPQWMGGRELTLGIKGALEQLPWLALPSATGVAGKAAGIAAKGGKLGMAARIAEQVLKPAVAVERVSAIPFEKLASILKRGKAAQRILKPIRKEELSAKFGAFEEAWAKGEGVKGFQAAKPALKGKLTAPEFEAPIEEMAVKDIDNLVNAIRDAQITNFSFMDKRNAAEAILNALTNQTVPRPFELKLIRRLNPELADAFENVAKSGGQKTLENILDIANAPRAGLTIGDVSATFRQGGILVTRFPTELPGAFKNQIKALLSDKNMGLVDDIIHSRKNYGKSLDYGVEYTKVAKTGRSLIGTEESYMSSYIKKIPILGTVVKASERAFVTFLNDLRSRAWERLYPVWERLGAKDLDFAELAKIVNYGSGRGNLGVLTRAGPFLNAILFSPKLVLAHVQLPGMLFSPSSLARKESARMLTQFMAAGTMILSMAKLAGAKVGADPRSSDFGKMRIGNTSLDVWAGYIQYARFIAQLTTAQRKTSGGFIEPLNRREVVDRFLQSKYSPAVGLLNDILRGETYMGESMELDTKSLKKQTYSRLVPLALQDIIDAANEDGLTGGLLASTGIAGIGVVTYSDKPKQVQDKISQKQFGMDWDDATQKYGQATMIKLGQSSEELNLALDERDEQMEGTVWSGWKREGQGIEDRFQQAVVTASKEYQQTKDGVVFRDKVDTASKVKREMYDERNKRKEYQGIVEGLNKPITDESLSKMNPLDIARTEYYKLMFTDDMYDEFGNYNFELADTRRQWFLDKFGQDAVDYIEDYMGVKWDAPLEYTALKQARKVLKPYWDVATDVTKLFGERFANSSRGQSFIGKQRKLLRRRDPEIAKYYDLFYKQAV